MSFMKTLATLAVGFAAAKGYDKFRKSGGMQGMQDSLKNASQPGGMADQAAAMAEKMGIPGGAETVRNWVGKMAPSTAAATEAAEAGLGSLVSAMTATAAAGSKAVTDMMDAVTKDTPANAVMEENAKLMIRAMIEAAKADGAIDAEEQARLTENLKDATPEEMAYVKELLAAPMDMAGLIAASNDTVKSQIFATSVMAMRLDTPAEQEYLARLAEGLGLSAEERDRIQATMGTKA